MLLANNAMHGCIFVTYIDICSHIMFPMKADHHGTSVRFPLHIGLKPLCTVKYGQMQAYQNLSMPSIPTKGPQSNQLASLHIIV